MRTICKLPLFTLVLIGLLAYPQAAQIARSPAYDANPSSSADGSTVAFVSRRDGSVDIRGTPAEHPAWSPEGNKPPFYSDQSTNHDSPVTAMNQFTRITEGDIVNDDGFSFGAAWIDYDNDGYLDLFVTNWWDAVQRNFLYHNDGDGTFTKITNDIIAYYGGSLASTWGDYDNDGDLDVLAANPGYGGAGAPNHFFVNNGDGSFTKVTDDTIATDVAVSTTPAWADYDNDGDLDLFVGVHCQPPDCGPSLYRNDGEEFTKMNNLEIGLTLVEGNGTWGDCDGDGDPDLLVTRPQLNTNSLFRNNGDGTFTEMTSCVISQDSSGVGSWGDYDNDGDLDVFATYGRNQPNILYQNEGGCEFIKITGQEIVSDSGYWSCACWGDYDNDGDLDLFVTGNYQYTPRLNALWENNGDGTFSKVTDGVLVTDLEASAGAACGDYDRDGDLDLLVANTNYEDNALYRNNGNSNNWITIRCIGSNSNRSAIGAKVRIRATIDGSPVWQLREISGQSSHFGQSSLDAHFGLRDAAVVDSIEIQWPSGLVDVLTDIGVNQFLTITETLCGDANGDQVVDIADVMFLINYLFIGGSAPDPLWVGDASGDGGVDVADVMYLINYLFIGGLPPNCQF